MSSRYISSVSAMSYTKRKYFDYSSTRSIGESTSDFSMKFLVNHHSFKFFLTIQELLQCSAKFVLGWHSVVYQDISLVIFRGTYHEVKRWISPIICYQIYPEIFQKFCLKIARTIPIFYMSHFFFFFESINNSKNLFPTLPCRNFPECSSNAISSNFLIIS